MPNIIPFQSDKKCNNQEKNGSIDTLATEIKSRLKKSGIFFDEIAIRQLASRIIELRSNNVC